MEDLIECLVEEKLDRYNLMGLKKLSDKDKERLIIVERFIQNNNKIIKQLIKEIKGLQLSKTSIANCKEVGVSRKTIYNDKILNKYIEASIGEKEDYFNDKKVQVLKQQIKELEVHYSKVLDNIIDINILRNNIVEYKNEIDRLLERNERLQSIIAEKESTINDLRNKLTKNNLVVLRK